MKIRVSLLLFFCFLLMLVINQSIWSAPDNLPLKKLFGLNFSPYIDGQDPQVNAQVSEKQITARMKIIAPYTEWIRTFSCTQGMENTGRIAHELGLKAAIGAWLDLDVAANDREIASLIKIAQSGNADILIIGNEVLFHRKISEVQLIKYMKAVKKEAPNIPVTTVDIYNEIFHRPKIVEACDIIMLNCYPFWEKRNIREALPLLKTVYNQAKTRFGNKEVVFAEVGWPSGGRKFGSAVPSLANAEIFFQDFTTWAAENKVPYYYFEAFDESWKAAYEKEYGAFWGIWDKNGKPKWNIGSSGANNNL